MKWNRICFYLLVILFFSINVFANDDKQMLDLANRLFQTTAIQCSDNDKCYCVEYKSKVNIPQRYVKSQFCKKDTSSDKQMFSFISWDKEGHKVDEGDYSMDGKMIGNWVSWHPNGEKAAEGLYSDGEPVGVHITWHKNGKRASKGQYLDGKMDGIWLMWDSSGNLKQKFIWNNGTLVSKEEQ